MPRKKKSVLNNIKKARNMHNVLHISGPADLNTSCSARPTTNSACGKEKERDSQPYITKEQDSDAAIEVSVKSPTILNKNHDETSPIQPYITKEQDSDAAIEVPIKSPTILNKNHDETSPIQPYITKEQDSNAAIEVSIKSPTILNKNHDATSPIQVEMTSTSYEPSTLHLEGRRIVNIEKFFREIKLIADHGPLGCGLGCVDIVGERQAGLSSKLTLQCKLCNLKFLIETDSPDDFNINHAAIAGTIAIGCGLWQLQELTAALNLPIITPQIYKQSHEKISEEFKKISVESMSQAAIKEREMSIDEGRVDKNGIPIIDVIVDGCWSKRSYKKIYSALSGAATIIGKRTGEVLFLGIRNKYCCICAQAEKKEIPPKEHVCYKNYNGPSTGMESDILVEGFKCSIEMHNLIYGRMVSDGDSNTYAKLLKSRPYPHVTIEKIECRNHLLRNLCNKMTQLQTETKYPLQFRKQLTQRKILLLRKTIRKIMKNYKTDSELDRRCNIEPLYNDILLAHLHAFGNHSQCKAYFCTNVNNPDQSFEATDQNFFTSTLWSRICLIMSNLASHAPSLVHDVDSNLVERYNSIVAKLVGGKRINFSQRGSYQTRCEAAVVSFNSKKMMSSLYKSIQGCSPKGKIGVLENRRQSSRVWTKKQKKKRRFFSKGNDANYGEQCEKPDMPPEMFEKEKKTFLKMLHRSEEERAKIQKDTVLQSSCSEWMEVRRTILTASNFGRVLKRRNDISCANIVKDILYKDSLSHVTSIKHGRDNEKRALQQLKIQENVDIKPCGLFIDEDIPFLGASPDGVIGEDMIVEIKCPISAFKEGIDHAIKTKKITFYKTKKNGTMEINKTHNWYYQIQGQLHIANKSKCLFGIWYGENAPLKTEIIEKDNYFWETEMKEKLSKFYLDCLLPELVDPRYSRNLKIRDPGYIQDAIKQKQEKKEEKIKQATSKTLNKKKTTQKIIGIKEGNENQDDVETENVFKRNRRTLKRKLMDENGQEKDECNNKRKCVIEKKVNLSKKSENLENANAVTVEKKNEYSIDTHFSSCEIKQIMQENFSDNEELVHYPSGVQNTRELNFFEF